MSGASTSGGAGLGKRWGASCGANDGGGGDGIERTRLRSGRRGSGGMLLRVVKLMRGAQPADAEVAHEVAEVGDGGLRRGNARGPRGRASQCLLGGGSLGGWSRGPARH
jgi:hypothetical protein